MHGSSYKQQIFPCNITGCQLLSHNAINIHTDDEYCVIFYRNHTAIFEKSILWRVQNQTVYLYVLNYTSEVRYKFYHLSVCGLLEPRIKEVMYWLRVHFSISSWLRFWRAKVHWKLTSLHVTHGVLYDTCDSWVFTLLHDTHGCPLHCVTHGCPLHCVTHGCSLYYMVPTPPR